MSSLPTVHIVDDDPQVRESLELLVRSIGLNVASYVSAEEYLETRTDTADTPACLVLDVRMPGLSGLGLHRELVNRGCDIPVIMISAYADVPMAVQAMSAGAMDFIEKPFDRQALVRRIMEALDRSAQKRLENARRQEVATRMENLSAREYEVMELLVAGKHAKHIAAEFGIGEKTVLKHRARVLEKMHVESVAELVRLALTESDLVSRPSPTIPDTGRMHVHAPLAAATM